MINLILAIVLFGGLGAYGLLLAWRFAKESKEYGSKIGYWLIVCTTFLIICVPLTSFLQTVFGSAADLFVAFGILGAVAGMTSLLLRVVDDIVTTRLRKLRGDDRE